MVHFTDSPLVPWIAGFPLEDEDAVVEGLARIAWLPRVATRISRTSVSAGASLGHDETVAIEGDVRRVFPAQHGGVGAASSVSDLPSLAAGGSVPIEVRERGPVGSLPSRSALPRDGNAHFQV
jgi:hypothetical protein